MFKSLLPSNATPLERDIEQVAAAKYTMPTPIADAWNAERCPTALLPWLAWAVSVDNWNADWDESVKRQVIANSIAMHQKKGTVAAVIKALKALHVQAELSEWYEYGGNPGTFTLLAWANDNLGNQDVVLSPDLYADLQRAVTQAAPVSRHFALTVGAKFKDSLAMAAGALQAIQTKHQYANAHQATLASAGSMFAAAHAHVYQVARYSGAY